MKGRAGALYILRIMREWLPDLATAINPVVTTLIEAILSQDRWVWNGNQYIGPVHGDIGIVTQIVLSDALYAPKLESKLLSLLKLQVCSLALPFTVPENRNDLKRSSTDSSIPLRTQKATGQL